MSAERQYQMETYTGRLINPAEMLPGYITVEDIAHALSLQCRYAGHCVFHYSVALHSVLLSHARGLRGITERRWALMHDATEAYLVDIPRGVKNLPGMAYYKDLEDELQRKVAARFNLPPGVPKRVKELDIAICRTERRMVMAPSGNVWKVDSLKEPELDIPVPTLAISPEYAEALFLLRFNKLFPKGTA